VERIGNIIGGFDSLNGFEKNIKQDRVYEVPLTYYLEKCRLH